MGVFLHRLPELVVADRDQTLLRLAAGRRVIHIGCADSPFTEDKLASGELLHHALLQTAESVLGVDTDRQAVDLLQERLSGEYIVCDISDPSSWAQFPEADIIIAGDVVEHVGDEASFLAGLAGLALRSSSCEIAISTPNALAFRTVIYSLCRREVIHPDHRRVHSPRTLDYSLAAAGIEASQWFAYTIASGVTGPRRAVDGIARLMVRCWGGGLADGLIVLARPRRLEAGQDFRPEW